MKKILSFVLMLAMVLSMCTFGFTVSAEDTAKPQGAIAINQSNIDTVLKQMQPGKYYYLTEDITLGSPQVRDNEVDANGLTPLPETGNDHYTITEPAIEEALITIPAGVTLDGNGFTIYHGYYVKNPGWYATNNKYVNSLKWTHELFQIAAATAQYKTTTIKNLNVGSESLPVYLSVNNATAEGDYTSNDAYSIFRDDAASNVVWDDVNVYMERYGRGLTHYNYASVMFKVKGTHNFNKCTVNTSTLSAGSQAAGWFYYVASGAKVTMNECGLNGFAIEASMPNAAKKEMLAPQLMGSYASGWINTIVSGATVTMTKCTNDEDLKIISSYAGAPQIGGFVMYNGGTLKMTDCTNKADIRAENTKNATGTAGYFSAIVGNGNNVTELVNCKNYGAFELTGTTIGGAILGRGDSGNTIKLIGCENHSDITTNASVTGNHGFGGIAGHTGASKTYIVDGCINTGNIKGTGNLSGIIGFAQGNATKKISNCVNSGTLTSNADNNPDIGAIISQLRVAGEITNCINTGAITSAATEAVGGILGRDWSNGTTIKISNCENQAKITATANTKLIGGLVGANNYATMTIENSANSGELVGCDATTTMAGVIAYSAKALTVNTSKNTGKITASKGTTDVAGLVANAAAGITMDSCGNHGAIAGADKTAREGGLVANVGAKSTFTNCRNYGVLTSSLKSTKIGGILGGNSATGITVDLTNCKNFGDLGSKSVHQYVGGIVGQTNAATYNLTGCENYGLISSVQYSAGMIAEASGASTVKISKSYNYGEIQGYHAVAGFVGQYQNNTSSSLTIEDSVNLGYIHPTALSGGEGIGGFVGRINDNTAQLQLTNCVNLGTVKGSTKANVQYGLFGDSFGQFIGGYRLGGGFFYKGDDVADKELVAGFLDWEATGAKKPVLTNCHAYGEAVVGSATASYSLKGWIGKTRVDGVATPIEGGSANYINQKIVVTTAPNDGVAGILVEYTGTVKTLTGTALSDAIANVKNVLGLNLMAGNTANGEAKLVIATPALRGYQMSLDGTSIRFSSVISSLNYKAAGYEYSVEFNGKEVVSKTTETRDKVSTKLKANVDGSIVEEFAADMGGKYFTGLTFTGIPTKGTVKLTVTPITIDANNNKLSGTTYVATIVDGEVTSVVEAKAA